MIARRTQARLRHARLLVAADVIVLAAVVWLLGGSSTGLPRRTVTVYGAAGTFGHLDRSARLPSGQSLDTRAVRGWAFRPGEAAYFTVVAPDGTVVMANEPQTDNQLRPTARQMAISTFNLATDGFRNIVIPTTTGATGVGGPWPSPTWRVGGADVSDLAVVPSGTSAAGIAFLSAMPYEGWNIRTDGVYPTLGYLTDGRSGWSYDAAASRTALQIANSAGNRTGQPCPVETGLGAEPFADCGLPAQLALLPQSGDLVVTQYGGRPPGASSGGLMVLSRTGRVLATYAYPRITLPDGRVVQVDPREVDADPVSPFGDEHFVVVFDSTIPTRTGTQLGPFAMQEFAFDPRTDMVIPLSAPVLSGELAPKGRALGFETASYDRDGNLWAAQSDNGTLTAGPLVVYRHEAGGSTLARPGCSVTPRWSGAGWATTCRPDLSIGHAASLGIVRSLNQDPRSGAMLAATMSGRLLVVRPQPEDRGIAGQTVVDLGLDELANRATHALDLRQGSIDPATDTLYLPVQQLQSSAECRSYPCEPTVLAQWLYAIRLAPILQRSDSERALRRQASR